VASAPKANDNSYIGVGTNMKVWVCRAENNWGTTPTSSRPKTVLQKFLGLQDTHEGIQ